MPVYVDDDFEGEVPDGFSVRVPALIMDAMQREIAGVNLSDHQPGFRSASDSAARDARAAARDAYFEMVKRTETAWRLPSRDAAEPASEELLRKHLRSEPDDNAQARRDRAWAQYRDQLGRAWQLGRTDPGTAGRIEKEREQYFGKR
jgi:hypothetical protein